jgi:hypothetical protein
MAMSSMVTATLTQRITGAHEQLLGAASEADEDQFRRWLGPNVPSIGWHVWHMARWADRVQALLPIMIAEDGRSAAPQAEIWEADSLASKWQFDRTNLGYGQTGMEMGDSAAASLRLPDKASLIDYARRAFSAAEETFGGIRDGQLARRGPDVMYAGRVDRERSVCEAVIGHLSHASRHLGMMEGIRPLLLQKPGSMTF